MLCCLPRKLISCGSLACVASVSVWSREENGAGNALPFPSFIFLAVVPFFLRSQNRKLVFLCTETAGNALATHASGSYIIYEPMDHCRSHDP